jgi:hypothetical protein
MPAPDDNGSLQSIFGFGAVTNPDTGSSKVLAIAQEEKSSTQKRRWFYCGDTSTYLLTAVDTVRVKIKGGLTANQRFSIVTLNDKTFFFNGVNTPFKFDYSADTSSAISNMGLTQPTLSGTTSSLGGLGEVKGIVSYYVSFLNGTTEEALSVSFGTINAESGREINLTSLPTSGSKDRNIYRTLSGGKQPFFVGTVGNSSATIFSDNTRDTELGGPPPQHGVPPPDKAHFAIVHFNRLWIAGMNSHEVQWSDLEYPESFNPYSFLKVWADDGDQITGLSRASNGIYIWKNNHIYKAIGKDPEADIMDVIELQSADPNFGGLGCASHWAKVSVPEIGQFFYFDKGIYLLTDAEEFRLISNDIQDEMRDDIYEPDQQIIIAGYSSDHRCVAFSVPTDSAGYNKRTYFYWLDTMSWTRMNEGFTSWAVIETGTDGTPPDGKEWWVHQASSSVRTISRMGTSFTTFNGSAIVATATMHPIGSDRLALWQDVRLWFKQQTSGSLKFLWDFWDNATLGNSASVSLAQSGLSTFNRRIRMAERSESLSIQIRFDGGAYAPIIKGIQITGITEGEATYK